MLNNLSENSPLVQDFVKVLLKQDYLGYCDADDALEAMVETSDSIEDFKNAAGSHRLETKTVDGIDFIYGFLTEKTDCPKKRTREVWMMERDGWTVVVTA